MVEILWWGSVLMSFSGLTIPQTKRIYEANEPFDDSFAQAMQKVTHVVHFLCNHLKL